MEGSAIGAGETRQRSQSGGMGSSRPTARTVSLSGGEFPPRQSLPCARGGGTAQP